MTVIVPVEKAAIDSPHAGLWDEIQAEAVQTAGPNAQLYRIKSGGEVAINGTYFPHMMMFFFR